MRKNPKKHIELTFSLLKHAPKSIVIPTEHADISLMVINENTIKNNSTIKILAKWRKNNQQWFPSQFKVTIAGTKKWAIEQLIEKPDRILFLIVHAKHITPLGHIGLYRFDYKNLSCEIDNVIRGEQWKNTKGAMTYALKSLMAWAKNELSISTLFLTTFSDNSRAIELYSRCGFDTYQIIPLKKVIHDSVITWEATDSPEYSERKSLKMVYKFHEQ